MPWNRGSTFQLPPLPNRPLAGHHPHRHAIDSPQLLPDGEDVQQGLGGMFSDPIPGVDHRPPAVLGCQLRKWEQGRRILPSTSPCLGPALPGFPHPSAPI